MGKIPSFQPTECAEKGANLIYVLMSTIEIDASKALIQLTLLLWTRKKTYCATAPIYIYIGVFDVGKYRSGCC